jgi:hypothetical protein
MGKEAKEYSRYEAAVVSAKAKGCIVVVPKPDKLFIDIDDAAGLATFNANLERVREIVPFTYRRRSSPSGAQGRYHILAKLSRAVGLTERILLQALLGSDLTREALSWQRADRGDPVPTPFFEKEPWAEADPEDPFG